MSPVAVLQPRGPVPKDLEPVLIDINRYLIGIPIKGKHLVARVALQRRARSYMEWNERLFRRSASGPRFTPMKADPPQILRSYHKEI